MNRGATYETKRHRTGMQDVETWLGNSLAVILAGLGVVSGVIGMFVAFGYTDVDAVNEFNYGIIWMIGGLILAICANVFRREHHIHEFDDDAFAGGGYRSTTTTTPRSSYDEPATRTTENASRGYEERTRR